MTETQADLCRRANHISVRERNRKMEEKKKYYITTAIAYTSGKPHIGNTYEIVLADSIARFKRNPRKKIKPKQEKAPV